MIRIQKLLLTLALFTYGWGVLAQSSTWTGAAAGPAGGTVSQIFSDASGTLYTYVSSDGRVRKSTDGGANWQSMPGLPPGFHEDFIIDGSKFLLLDWSGFHVSSDNGTNWTKINTSAFEGGQEISVVPTVNGYLVVGDLGALLSLDNGVTWKKIYNGKSGKFAIASTGDIYIADPEVGIVKHAAQSTLNGWDVANWQTVYPKEFSGSDFVLSVGVNRANADKVYITYRKANNTGTLIKSSVNGGSVWTVVTPPQPDLQVNRWFSSTTDSKLFLVSCHGIYNITDGATPVFSLKTSPGYSGYCISTIYYKAANEIYAGAEGDGIWKSNDGMLTWNDISGTSLSSAIAVPPGKDVEVIGSTLLFTKDFGSKACWYSLDNGVTFTRKDLPFFLFGQATGKLFKRLQNNALIANSSQGTQITSDGINWGQLSTLGFSDYVTVGTTDFYGFSDNGLIRKGVIINSIAGDLSTAVTATGLPASYQLLNVVYANGYFYLAIHNQVINPSQLQFWRLNLATLVATQLTTSLTTQTQQLRGIFVMNNKLYLGDGKQIAISNDQGNTFTYLSNPHERILPVFQNGNALGVSRGGTFVTTKDDGQTWSSNAVPNDQVIIQNVTVVSPNLSFAAGFNAPLLKSDSVVRKAAPTYIDFGWSKLNGPYGGGGRKLFKNAANQLFADAFFSVHRYTNGDPAWETLEKVEMNNHGSYVDAAGTIYQSTNNQFFKSMDGGNTFTYQGGGYDGVNGGGVFKDSSGNLYVLTYNGLFRSVNDGVTFSKPASAASGSYLEIVQSGATLLTVKVEAGTMSLQRSVDNGATWTSVSGVTFPNANRNQNVLAASASAFVVVTSNGIYKSTDGALNWTSIKSNITETSFSDFGSIAFFGPTGDYYFYLLGYPGKIYRSTDQGASWTVVTTGTTNSLHDVRSFCWIGTRLYAYSVFKGISYSDNGGATFVDFINNKGLTNYDGRIRTYDGRLLMATGNEIVASTDQGNTWGTIYNEGVGRFLDLPNGDIIAYGNTIAKSTDRGITWTKIKGCCSYLPVMTATTNGFVAFGSIDGINNQLFTSSDLVTWTILNLTGLQADLQPQYLTTLGDQLFMLGYSNVFRRNQLFRINAGTASLVDIAIDPVSIARADTKIFAFSSEGSVFETSNGTSWTKRATPAGRNFLIANNGYLFVTGNKGEVWVSRDNGVSWQKVSATNFGAIFTDISIDLSNGYAYGTAQQRGVLKSANRVIPDDKTGPTLSSLTPVTNTGNVPLTGLRLTLTFNEYPKAVAGKKLKLYNAASPATPVETLDASAGVTAGTTVAFTSTLTLTDVTSYYVIVESGAFTDIFGNPFGGITNSTDWKFTTVDATAPVLSFTTSNLSKGVAKSFSVTATDNVGVAQDKIKMYHRGVATTSNTGFISDVLTVASGGSATNLAATISVVENWYDGMGLEFYFESEDLTGNKVRLPATANTYFYSYIEYPAGAQPKLAGIGYGGEAASYRMIGVPYELSDNTIATQFDELGPANKSSWRLLTYGSSGYEDVADGNLTSLQRGKGYWINVRNFTEILLDGAKTPANNRTSFFSIDLKPGWNQISNPYPVPISWNETIAGKTGIGSLKIYNNGYANGDVLGPYDGGFVFLTGAAQSVKVRFQGITTGGRMASASSDIDSPFWDLPLAVVQGTTLNQLPGIGMNPEASEEFDSFDDPSLPLFSGIPQAEVQFLKIGATTLTKDVVATASEYVWQFKTTFSKAGQAQLSWQNELLNHSRKDLYLFDLDLQILVNMKEQSNYSFDNTKSKNFQIHFGSNLSEKIKPTANFIGDIYPNPAQHDIIFPVAVSETGVGANLLIELYNHNGQRIQMHTINELENGFHQIHYPFDGELSNGIYLVKTILQTAQEVKVHTSKLIVNR